MKGQGRNRRGGSQTRPQNRGQRGQTLLEFALVAPLLLVFLLGLVDFGIAIDRRLVLDHAVREGARFASVGGDALATGVPATEQDVKDYVAAQAQGILNAAELNPNENGYIGVCYEFVAGVPVSVEIDVTYTHDFVTGFTSIVDAGVVSIEMNPSASARVEQVAGISECV